MMQSVFLAQSAPLSVSLQPARSSYEQLIDLVKQLFVRVRSQQWVVLPHARMNTQVTSPSGGYAATMDLTSMVAAAAFKSEIQEQVKNLFIGHFETCLSPHSANRLSMLFDCESGWDGAAASSLDLSSLYSGSYFISNHDIRGIEVGVFMSPEGNLVLNWPSRASGEMVEVEFFPDCYSLYLAGREDAEYFDFGDKSFEDAVSRTL